ncbi:MAG: hypothetical protein NVS4B7_08240 [Ktedonobacteraceae bacterium]
MFTHILSICLQIVGALGTTVLLGTTVVVIWHYRGTRIWSFRWYWRNQYLTQLSAIATLFFLAMTASYGLLGEVWTWIYFIAAFKTGTWWLRNTISRRT